MWVFKILLIAASAACFYFGVSIYFQWSSLESHASAELSSDSSYTKNTSTDTANHSKTVITENKVFHSLPGTTTETSRYTHRENMLKKSYEWMQMGILLLLLLFILPFLTEFNFLSLFSVKLQQKVESSMAIINEGASAANSIPVLNRVDLVTREVSTGPAGKTIQQSAEEGIPRELIQAYQDDKNKDQFGKSPERNKRRLSASVVPIPSSGGFFKITLKVISTDPGGSPLTGKVIFHLHKSFPAPNPTIYVQQGVARLELVAWGAFTVGAEADMGTTRLELDLADIPGAPTLFKSR